MAKAKEGPGALLSAALEQVDAIQKKLQAGLSDPSSLVGGSGGAAGCIAGWYGGEVAKKLQGLSDEASGLTETMKKMAANVQTPMQSLAEGLEKAVSQLQASVQSLAKMPKLLQKELEGKDSPDDVAKINTEQFKQALQGGDLDGPLAAIGGMKGLLGTAIAALRGGVEVLEGFLQTSPATVRGAFDLPAPLCALQSALMSQAPQLMTDLLGMLEKLQGVSLQPILDALMGTQGQIGGLDVETIKAPVSKFMESATALVEKLDQTVSAAKMAGGAAALANATPPEVPKVPEVPTAPAPPTGGGGVMKKFTKMFG